MSGATEESRIEMLDAHRQAVDGVAQVLKALQELPDDVRFLKDRIVSNLLWVVTEFKPGAKHKILGVRWRTPAAHDLVQTAETKSVRHEHVVERNWMIQFLHDHPTAIDPALWNYPACLVTTTEHTALGTTSAWGWARYIAADIQVIDATNGRSVDLVAMNTHLRKTYESFGAELAV